MLTIRDIRKRRAVWPWTLFVHLDSPKLLTCPIPRVGCSSLVTWLGSLRGWPRLTRAGAKRHLTRGDAVHHFGLWDMTVSDAMRVATASYRFAFVRDPWSRFVSAYLHLRIAIPLCKCGRPHPTNFRTFVRGALAQPWRDIHWRSMVDFLRGMRWHDVWHLEEMDACLAKMNKRFGLDGEIVRQNQSGLGMGLTLVCGPDMMSDALVKACPNGQYPAYQRFYDQELVEQVGEAYQEDVREFHFEPPEVE